MFYPRISIFASVQNKVVYSVRLTSNVPSIASRGRWTEFHRNITMRDTVQTCLLFGPIRYNCIQLRWTILTCAEKLTSNLPHGTKQKVITKLKTTRRPASADRTARRQFQATGQPVSRTQASDAMASRLPRCEANCVQRRCFQCGSVPLRSDIKGTELPAAILIPLERQLIALQLCR